MLKKVGIIGSGVAGVTLLKALADQTLAKNSSKTKTKSPDSTYRERKKFF